MYKVLIFRSFSPVIGNFQIPCLFEVAKIWLPHAPRNLRSMDFTLLSSCGMFDERSWNCLCGNGKKPNKLWVSWSWFSYVPLRYKAKMRSNQRNFALLYLEFILYQLKLWNCCFDTKDIVIGMRFLWSHNISIMLWFNRQNITLCWVWSQYLYRLCRSH